MPSEQEIIEEARKWIGTPYQHQASCLQAGCDCLGLVRGVWRELIGGEPELVPPYTPNWAEHSRHETLQDAARRHLTEIPIGNTRPGDLLLFRMALGAPAKHIAIVSETDGGRPTRIIHAYWGRSVVETYVGNWWMRRIASAFRFPENQ
ncbi:NlpC/P60 family protein [Hirschia maritima]|uniref:NlpC/P60 family protein n=1 Tax=Hirschia maritima TaxID=1121961 RepID=UPI0003A770A3|nr:NlpC/P60 family protein [Hirschia maritima]